MIKFIIYLLLAAMVFALVRTHFSVRRSQSPQERAVTIRLSAFAWLTAFLFIIALVFLPAKQQLLMLLPIFVFAVGFAKFWRDKRARIRREHDERVNLERMKRVN